MHCAFGRLQVARQYVHQRRFAGTVLADDGMHFARPEGERDVVERQHPGEALGDAMDLDDMGMTA
jgi:hypothetical protein